MFSFFQNHPKEIKIEIFNYLTALEKVKISGVCKQWNTIIKEQMLHLSDQKKLELSRQMLFSVGCLQNEIWQRYVHGFRSPEPNHQKYIAEIREFLAKGGDPNTTNECGAVDFPIGHEISKASLLHGAVLVEDYSLADMLIKKGAKVNYQTVQGHTPLHYTAFASFYAVHGSRPKIAKLLIENGADITLKDSDNKSVVDLARENGCKDLADAISTNSGWELITGAPKQISDEEMAKSNLDQGSYTARKK